MKKRKTTKPEPENSENEVELGVKGLKAKNVSTKQIIILVIGLIVAIAVYRFKYSTTTAADGSTTTEFQLREVSKPDTNTSY